MSWSDFGGGLREIILAGVDGYATIETAKLNADNRVEQTPPVPPPDRMAVTSQSIVSGVSNSVLMLGIGAVVFFVMARK